MFVTYEALNHGNMAFKLNFDYSTEPNTLLTNIARSKLLLEHSDIVDNMEVFEEVVADLTTKIKERIETTPGSGEYGNGYVILFEDEVANLLEFFFAGSMVQQSCIASMFSKIQPRNEEDK